MTAIPLLSILSVGSNCEVALLIEGEGTPISMDEPGLTGQDMRLPRLVDQCLEQAGLSFSDLERIAVCVGPGSFTGVRVGVAYARGLALALKRPCIGITSTLAAVAPSGVTADIRVALAAKRRPPDQTVWTQQIAPDGPVSAPEEWPMDQLLGDDLPLHGDVQDVSGRFVVPAAPSALNGARWARQLDLGTYPPTPTYVRAPDAKLPGGVTP